MSNEDSLQGGTQATSVTITVLGMTCDHCSKRVEKALRSLDGVEDVRVDRAGGAATVAFDGSRLGAAHLREVVIRSGFKSPV